LRLFDLTLRAKGFDISKARGVLDDIQSIADNDYERYVISRRNAIIEYHLKHNAFYKKKGVSIDLQCWDSVPVISKKDLQQPIETLLSSTFKKRDVYIDKTSGASGTPFIFPKDNFCHALTWAVIMNRFSWYGIDFNTSKQARFYGIPLNRFGYYKERLKDVLANRYRFSVFNLTDAAFEKCLKTFSKTPFNYINGYTSVIVQFAKYLKRQQVILKDVCPTLTACMVTSEMLFDDDKALLEHQFGIKIVKEYGASELDLIAFEHPNGDWQLNSETLFVEILDEHNKALPYGEEGRLVITSLYNKAFPFIRYEIGDIGALSKKSTLKRPILKQLIGRTNDIVYLPSGKKAAGLTFYYITKQIIEDDGAVKAFVIDQLDLHHFKITYTSTTQLSDKKKQAVLKAIQTYLEKGLMVSFERYDDLKRSQSGKLKQFTSHIKH